MEDDFENFFNIDAIPGERSDGGSMSPSTSIAQSMNGKKKDDRLWHRGHDPTDGPDGHSSDDEEPPAKPQPQKQNSFNQSLAVPLWNNKGAAGGLGCATPDALTSSLAPSPSAATIGEEGDRFADGPYEPMLSFERCRFAAYTQWTTLGHVLQHLNPGRTDETWTDEELHTAPLLPPLSCCSYVLGAYATLMQCLYVQLYGQDKATADILRDRAWQIERALQRFVRHWNTLQDYRGEVATLLNANQSLVEQKNDSSGLMEVRGSTKPYQT